MSSKPEIKGTEVKKDIDGNILVEAMELADTTTKITYKYEYITGKIPDYDYDKPHHCEIKDHEIINTLSLDIEGTLLEEYKVLKGFINAFNNPVPDEPVPDEPELEKIKKLFKVFSNNIGAKIRKPKTVSGGKTKKRNKHTTSKKTKKRHRRTKKNKFKLPTKV